MREAAEAYCRVIETARESDREAFVADSIRTLAVVLAVAYQVPSVEPATDSSADGLSGGISHERWLAVMTEVATVLDVWDNYWTTLDVYRLHDSTGAPDLTSLSGHDFAVNLSLADALADIWRDLRNVLNLAALGAPEDDVTWEWRFGLRTHWGAHAVEALRALHAQIKTRSNEIDA